MKRIVLTANALEPVLIRTPSIYIKNGTIRGNDAHLRLLMPILEQ
jgi:hypothetical protein